MAAGAASRQLVQCPGHGVFPQRRPRHSSGSPPLPLATCGFSEPREGAGAAESPEPPLAGLTTPFFTLRLALAGHLRVATLIKIQAGPCPCTGRRREGSAESGFAPEGGSGVPDRVDTSYGPWRGWGGASPEGFPAICCSSVPHPWVLEVICVAGTGESWELEFLKLLPPEVNLCIEVENWADTRPCPVALSGC